MRILICLLAMCSTNYPINWETLCKHFVTDAHFMTYQVFGGRQSIVQGKYYKSFLRREIPNDRPAAQFCQEIAPSLQYSHYMQIGGRNTTLICFYPKYIRISPLTTHYHIAHDEQKALILHD